MKVLMIQLSIAAIGSACMATNPGTSPAACKNCAMNLITISTAGAGAKYNAGDGTIQDDDDGQVDGTTISRLTCNAAGTAWVETNGLVITRVECATNA